MRDLLTITLDAPDDYLEWRGGMGGNCEIYDIAIHSERGKGKGRRLVNLLIDEVKGRFFVIYAITRMNNTIAQQFYEALGFRVAGRLHDFYCEEKPGPVTDLSGSHRRSHAIMYVLDLPTDATQEFKV